MVTVVQNGVARYVQVQGGEVYCSLCDAVHGKENCPCRCSKCGGEIDSEGFCPNYCIDGD